MEQVVYKSEAYQIIGIGMEVYNTLGYGFLEVVYKVAMEIEFLQRNINYRREDAATARHKGKILKHKFFADHDTIIVEVKAHKDGITDDMIAQTLNYLKVSGLRLALIINFGKTSLDYKRLVY